MGVIWTWEFKGDVFCGGVVGGVGGDLVSPVPAGGGFGLSPPEKKQVIIKPNCFLDLARYVQFINKEGIIVYLLTKKLQLKSY